ncbi:3'-5' exoribonuclease [Comamonas aquatica]|uniref:3'-5' exonuclease n=1 Tax=Comamonas aquatica TaxID=225991 RepID=UPI0022DCF9FA|nr:3'-5' exonuclease [Comamonas aquatica]WBM43091.1 3'-5' exoribonuclease [Comamonas aquatica]
MNSQPQSNAPQAAHIVLDLETLSTQPNAVIASIGAVALTASGGFVSEFHVPITTGNFRQCHRHVCAKTVEWWEQQSEEAKLASVKAPNPTLPHPALQAFIAWVHEHADPKKVKVWGNGSSFDNVILSSLFADYPELERPWAYWNDRDMRTVLDLNPAAKDVGPFEGVKHNALHDARHEAKQLAKVLMATQPAAQGMDALTSAARDVLAERKRQIETEGWKPERDDVYDTGEMALAAACYAAHSASCAAIKAPHTARGVFVRTRSAQDFVGEMWPWSADWWKPSGHRRNLEKAAALILAEIERIDRAALAAQAKQEQAA